MSLINWTDPEERASYFHKKGIEYRKSHPRLSLTFSQEEYEWVERSASHFGAEKVSRHVKALAIEAAKLGLGEQVERQPQIPQEIIDEMLFLLHNTSNNLNQTAYRLNRQALEHHRVTVQDNEDSIRTIDECYRILRDLETELLPLIKQSQ